MNPPAAVDDAVRSGSPAPAPSRWSAGLSGRLLALTVLFVMISEVLIYVPSIANFQRTTLADRLDEAAVAAVALRNGRASPALAEGLLAEVDATALALKGRGSRWLLAMTEMPPTVDRDLDLPSMHALVAIREAFDTLFFGGDRTIRLTGPFGTNGAILEVVFSERGLRAALLAYSRNILLLSLVISALTALLVYASLKRLFVRPMLRLQRAVERFSEDPEDPGRILVPSSGAGEIEATERRLAAMQTTLQDTLKQQRRLADLGLAVSKVNHDLRNLLASAQLISDRLAPIADPTVQRFAPKLISALDRAIGYCQSVLAYGKAQEPAPERRLVDLGRLVEEVGEAAGITERPEIDWVTDVPEGLEVDADPDQFFRVLMNLVRNAAEALDALAGTSVVRRIVVSGSRTGGVVTLRIADSGAGIPPHVRADLFRPFKGSARSGGTGLGLAIAAEILRAHGGIIRHLAEAPGAVFEIELPDRPIALATAGAAAGSTRDAGTRPLPSRTRTAR